MKRATLMVMFVAFLTKILGFLAVGLGVLVYAVLIYFLKVPEVQRTLKTIRSRVEWNADDRGEQ